MLVCVGRCCLGGIEAEAEDVQGGLGVFQGSATTAGTDVAETPTCRVVG